MRNFNFPKQSKMTLKTDIDKVMSAGQRLFGKNLVLRYRLENRADSEMKILVVASKRRYKLAVTRNRIKRQLREMIRHQKPIISKALAADQTLHLALIYTGPAKMDFELTNKNLIKALRKIEQLYLNNN